MKILSLLMIVTSFAISSDAHAFAKPPYCSGELDKLLHVMNVRSDSGDYSKQDGNRYQYDQEAEKGRGATLTQNAKYTQLDVTENKTPYMSVRLRRDAVTKNCYLDHFSVSVNKGKDQLLVSGNTCAIAKEEDELVKQGKAKEGVITKLVRDSLTNDNLNNPNKRFYIIDSYVRLVMDECRGAAVFTHMIAPKSRVQPKVTTDLKQAK